MEDGKTKKPTTKRTSRKTAPKQEPTPMPTPEQIYDEDADLALALSNSQHDMDSGAARAAAEAAAWNRDELEAQSLADEEYARQLAAEFEAEYNPPPAPNSAHGGDDMDSILEQIAQQEANERLAATGHAYRGKTNIDRILAAEEEEEARIMERARRDAELREWRAERQRHPGVRATATHVGEADSPADGGHQSHNLLSGP